MPGRLISFEGIDGAGKSTQLALAQAALQAAGQSVLALREPGGTPAGEALRELIKAGSFSNARSELLAFSTARAELVHSRIRPALERGEIVLLDRFTDSSLAYQGALGGLDLAEIHRINEFATAGLKPDLTFWFDIEPGLALGRRLTNDSIEQREMAYFERVRGIFARICEEEPWRLRRIPVEGNPQEVFSRVSAELDRLLGALHG